jgi:hypothetical protein
MGTGQKDKLITEEKANLIDRILLMEGTNGNLSDELLGERFDELYELDVVNLKELWKKLE